MDLPQMEVEPQTRAQMVDKTEGRMSTSWKWTRATTKRWRDERSSIVDPNPKKPRLEEEHQPDEEMDQDQSMVEEMMPWDSMVGADRPHRRCWRQARRETG